MPITKLSNAIIAVPLLLAFLVMAPSDARADGHLEKMIDARQGYYQVVSHNAGVLFAMAKGDIAYDGAAAQTAADNLLLMTKIDVSSMWAPGTSKEEMPGKTRALKKIWDTWPAIGEKSKAWKDAVAEMADAASFGLDELRAKAAGLGAGCKGCHDNFRAENF